MFTAIDAGDFDISPAAIAWKRGTFHDAGLPVSVRVPSPLSTSPMTSESTSNPTFLLGGALTIENGRVHLHDATALTSAHMDALVWQAVFADETERNTARWPRAQILPR